MDTNEDGATLLVCTACTKELGRTCVSDDVYPLLLLEDKSVVGGEPVLPTGSDKSKDVDPVGEDGLEANEQW